MDDSTINFDLYRFTSDSNFNEEQNMKVQDCLLYTEAYDSVGDSEKALYYYKKYSDERETLTVNDSEVMIKKNEGLVERLKAKLSERKQDIKEMDIALDNMDQETIKVAQVNDSLSMEKAAIKGVLDEKLSVIKAKDVQLQLEKERQKNYKYFLLLFILLFFIVLIFYYSTYRSHQNMKKANEKIKKMNGFLEKMATTDPLTKLFNRRYMTEKILDEVTRFARNKKTFAIVICDIDKFKNINDSYGHDAGDYILVTISQLMVKSVRLQDTVARWGGEEFLFLLPETELKGGGIVAEVLRKKIEEQNFIYNKTKIPVTMTFGVSVFDREMEYKDVIKNADEALYEGKESGRNKVVFSKINEIKKNSK